MLKPIYSSGRKKLVWGTRELQTQPCKGCSYDCAQFYAHGLNLIEVFRFQRKTLLFLLGFFFLKIIIKVFRFQRKTLLLFFGFFIFFFFFFFFLTPFLLNAWTDFHEIFRDGVYWYRKTEINFREMTSLPVQNIDEFFYTPRNELRRV